MELIELPTQSEYDTLVLSGGSSKGILTLGALQYCYDTYLLNKIETYVGTSSGAIISFLLIIGYSPIEIMVYICCNGLLEKMQHFNFVSMINGTGATSFVNIYEQLEKITIDKIGYIPTLLDLKVKYNKTLICTTYNLTKEKTEYMSHETHPNLPSLIALKMSSNLPLIFENFKYNSDFYVDGGVSDNFPIDVGVKIGKKVLGILLSSQDNFEKGPDIGILEFIYKLLCIPISQNTEYKINQATGENCKIIRLSYDKIKFFNFNIHSKEKLDIFSIGYEQMKTQI